MTVDFTDLRRRSRRTNDDGGQINNEVFLADVSSVSAFSASSSLASSSSSEDAKSRRSPFSFVFLSSFPSSYCRNNLLRRSYLPAPQSVDVRSLAALRILLAVYVLVDVKGRLADGWASLSWYYSDPTGWDWWDSNIPDPIFRPYDHYTALGLRRYRNVRSHDDVPWTDRTLCHRGTAPTQVVLFGLTVIFAVLFGAGMFFLPVPGRGGGSGCGGRGGGRLFGFIVPATLWFLVTGMHCRVPDIEYNDSSDVLLSNLLLWCIVTPSVNAVWSFDSWWEERRRRRRRIRRRKQAGGRTKGGAAANAAAATAAAAGGDCGDGGKTTQRQRRKKTVSAAGTLGLTTQIVLVYLGLTTNRLKGTKWLYPDLSAVYNALSVPVYARPHVVALVQSHPLLAKVMAAGSWFFEVLCPFGAYLSPADSTARAVFALAIMTFHMVLWACIRIPAYQWICAIEAVIFLPGRFWDGLPLPRMMSLYDEGEEEEEGEGEVAKEEEEAGVQKEEGCHPTTTEDHHLSRRPQLVSFPSRVRSLILSASSRLLLVCMVLTFLRSKGWIAARGGTSQRLDMMPYPLGKIPSALKYISLRLHFGQFWNIYGPNSPKSSAVCTLTGRYDDENYGEETGRIGPTTMRATRTRTQHMLKRHASTSKMGTRMDILSAMRSHDFATRALSDLSPDEYHHRLNSVPYYMSSQFSHWRWNFFLLEEVKHIYNPKSDDGEAVRSEEALEKVCRFLCSWINLELERASSGRRLSHVDLEFMKVTVQPMDEEGWYRPIGEDTWRGMVVAEC